MTGGYWAAALRAAVIGGLMMAGNATLAAGPAFDSATWTSVGHGKADSSDPRRPLIEPAIAAVPPGTSRADVRAVLGEPDRDNRTEWVYYAGTTLFGGEYTFLVIRFSGDAVSAAEKVNSETYVNPN